MTDKYIEERVAEIFDEYPNYFSSSPKRKIHQVRLSKEELTTALTEALTEGERRATKRALEATFDVVPLTEGDIGDYERGVIEGGYYVKQRILLALTPHDPTISIEERI